MQNLKINSILSAALLLSPVAASASLPISPTTPPAELSSQRASLRRMRFSLASLPKLEPMGTYVGQLQEQWQFPSDHLPIGMSLDGVHFASWNVLDVKYMDWVTEKNSQGLSRSQIADEHVYIEESELTVRDRHVVDLILEMIHHPTHPKQVLSLQECGDAFLNELKSRLPENFALVAHHGNAVVVDLNQFEMIEAKEVSGLFSSHPERSVQEVLLQKRGSGEMVRLVNAHLPGNPLEPGRYEFGQYLAKTFDARATTIAMGDMNFNELEMRDALQQAFSATSPFSLYSPYCTNITPLQFMSKCIDHFIVYSGKKPAIHAPAEVMIGLEKTSDLLQPITIQ